MTDSWYYTRDGQQLGPVSRAQLVAALRQSPYWHQEYVWKTGTPAWEQAGSIEELSAEMAQSHLEALARLDHSSPAKASVLVTILTYAGLALLGMLSAVAYYLLF
ncbi:MAG: DUF4339 domain-containing protein [Xanthobacteraceae bacterium]|nr:DUF4339 domain-containing protein [Xanthobacteraceae bacterium]